MPIDETKIVAQGPPETQKVSAKKTAPREDFSKILEQSRSPVHTVEKGDTLWNIVREKLFLSPERITNTRIANNVRKIVDFNRIKTPDLIYPGQKFDLSPMLSTLEKVPEIIIEPPPEKPAATVTDKPIDHLPEQPITAEMTDTAIPPVLPKDSPGTALPDTEISPVPLAAEMDASRQIIDAQKAEETVKPEEKPKIPEKIVSPGTLSEQMAKYKIDQLMAEPGGDFYSRNGGNVYVRPAYDQSEFRGRINKDLSDAGENIIRLLEDITKGSVRNYVGPEGDTLAYRRLGLFDALGNFVKNVSSGLTFGAYVPEGEEKPENGMERVKHFFSKIFKEGLLQDLGGSTTGAVVSGLRHSVLAAVNALEVVPDATIGNIEAGRKLTTNVFDNGQVVVSYLTDIIPGGEAWFRVNTPGSNKEGFMPPVYFNLKTAEQGINDPRWATIRNTPFRKTIESVGALISDAALLGLVDIKPSIILPSSND